MNILASLGLDPFFSDMSIDIQSVEASPAPETPCFYSLSQEDFAGTEKASGTIFTAIVDRITFTLFCTRSHGGVSMRLTATGPDALMIKSIALSLAYASQEDLSCARVPTGYSNVFASGMKLLGKETKTGPDSMMCGLFLSHRKPCLFLGTLIPQKNLHHYSTELTGKHSARIKSETGFTYGQRLQTSLSTETVWISTEKNPLDAISAWHSHFSPLAVNNDATIVTGWNSWDYYYSTVSHEDILENIAALKNDAIFADTIKYVTIDEGWQHKRGEWEPNYKFPGGMKYTADKIKEYGFVPGIWTSPLLVDESSFLALRQKDLLVKDEYGDPQLVDGTCLLDPTHPASAQYLYTMYRKLYDDGFRLFKVDFVSTITMAYTFWEQGDGAYDAIRKLFDIIRSAVTDESHIIGCAYPGEAGAGYVDSRRIGVDIHNHWAHVEWVTEYLQCCYWEGSKLAPLDADFLIVRAPETSLEAETEVTHLGSNRQQALGKAGGRWRAGPVWNVAEAQTWVNLVSFTGGSRHLSDRISMLNEKGKEMLYDGLQSPAGNAVPLDLGEKPLAEFWLQSIDGKKRLLVINFAEQKRSIVFDGSKYGLSSEVYITAMLDSHASAIFEL